MGKRVIVVGGGVSGLTAAAALAEGGQEVVLLEASARLGGRILTRRANGYLTELGAEFVHGESKPMEESIRAARLETLHVSEQNQLFQNGELRKVDLWGRAGEVVSRIDPRTADQSFLEFLRGQNFDAETHQIALNFVEGFNASDARKIGAHALLRADFSAGENAHKQKRIAQGYQGLVEVVS